MMLKYCKRHFCRNTVPNVFNLSSWLRLRVHPAKLVVSRAAEFETYDRFVFKNDVLYAFFMIKNRVKNVATKYRQMP